LLDNRDARVSKTLLKFEKITALEQLRSEIALIVRRMASAVKTKVSTGSYYL